MAEELADLFAAARSPTIAWDGAPVHAVWDIDPIPDHLVIEFQRGVTDPIQGLAIRLRGGMLSVNGVEATHLTLWRDTAPKDVSVVITKKKKDARLTLWNIWRETMPSYEVTQAWLRNAGMRIEPSHRPSETVLRCSDGVGPVDFDDLVVQVKTVASV